MREFVESKRCRHRQICGHFGEKPKWETCSACDVCGSTAEWMVKAPSVSPGTAVGRKRLPPAPTVAAVAGSEGDELREYLREWRRAMGKGKNVPADIVLRACRL